MNDPTKRLGIYTGMCWLLNVDWPLVAILLSEPDGTCQLHSNDVVVIQSVVRYVGTFTSQDIG